MQGGGVRGEVDGMGPPMQVTYRLQGLDGEATERMIEHLVEPASEKQEPEQEYSVARLLADQGPTGLALPWGLIFSNLTPNLIETTCWNNTACFTEIYHLSLQHAMTTHDLARSRVIKRALDTALEQRRFQLLGSHPELHFQDVHTNCILEMELRMTPHY